MRFLATFLGAIVGTILFLTFATYFAGSPFGDWFTSAHGLLVSEKRQSLTEQQNIEIYRMLSQGIIVSTDGVLDKVTSMYGNVIQVLVGALALATLFSFISARWLSTQAAQEFVETKFEKYLESSDFQGTLTDKVFDYLDLHGTPEAFTPGNDGDIDEQKGLIEELRRRIMAIEEHISQASSDEEEPLVDNEKTKKSEG
jgi:hypothetical protein